MEKTTKEGQKILVFGSYVTDLNARTPRFPAEGETIIGSMFKSGPGGKGSNQAVADVFLNKGVKNVIITLGNNGYYAKNAREEITGEAIDVNVLDTTGAGDAFNGGFAAALAENRELRDALRFANTVGGLSVEKIGTAPPCRTETRSSGKCTVKMHNAELFRKNFQSKGIIVAFALFYIRCVCPSTALKNNISRKSVTNLLLARI